eukprot:gnl/TRDRNA2_/TRDRNA2_168922_c1_seq1.p1 gnl/TRDRNA2_/TRDRNA2_168922_c1~~gnl/TRDRNA2_/TRDRNA2_168922_c1_seq1.p1  ORF type:complete len:130 (+),score=15.93 gnl/TRDRNA2_/TRDRNA2_168922_c1_seq1:51-392(+)
MRNNEKIVLAAFQKDPMSIRLASHEQIEKVAVQTVQQRGPITCYCGADCVEKRLGMLEGHVHKRECDNCKNDIPRQAMRWHCGRIPPCDVDVCSYCVIVWGGLEISKRLNSKE